MFERSIIAFGTLALMSFGHRAWAADDAVLIGDPTHGKKVYAKECADCHGTDGKGGRSGSALTDSARMNLVHDRHMFDVLQFGKGLKRPKEHSFKGKVDFLTHWDVMAYVRSMHMTLADFFSGASRYVSKEYEIDQYGLERIKTATGKALSDKSAAVYTFFTFEGEEGELRYVPQDPIELDHLKKDNKTGYLVFLPFSHDGFRGQIGVGMDKDGKILRIRVHEDRKGADLLNKSLSRFEGMGKKGQSEKFRLGGGKAMDSLADAVFPIYMRAMETVTMYDREERERTWADE